MACSRTVRGKQSRTWRSAWIAVRKWTAPACVRASIVGGVCVVIGGWLSGDTHTHHHYDGPQEADQVAEKDALPGAEELNFSMFGSPDVSSTPGEQRERPDFRILGDS